MPAAPHLTRCSCRPSAHVHEEDRGQRQPGLQSQSAPCWSVIGPLALRLLGSEGRVRGQPVRIDVVFDNTALKVLTHDSIQSSASLINEEKSFIS